MAHEDTLLNDQLEDAVTELAAAELPSLANAVEPARRFLFAPGQPTRAPGPSTQLSLLEHGT